MLLETGGAGIRFKPRLVEGVTLPSRVEPERLILDGQQRLTSLYQAVSANEPVKTRDSRGKDILRWYYLDIQKALSPNGDREEAIVALPEDKRRRNFRGEIEGDYSTRELECKANLFPLSILFDVQGLTGWQLAYLNADPAHMQVRLNLWNDLIQGVVQRVQQYQIPLIVLKKETPKVAVCQVFEKVNTGGVALNVFELLTATYAADDFDLRHDWEARERRFRKHKVLTTIANTDFLQAISLLASRARRVEAIKTGTSVDNAPGISCKRKEILDLSLHDYQRWADPVTQGFEISVRILHAQRIFAARDLPYRTQITPLAAVLAILGDRADQDGVKKKLARWHWCGVFGELYGGAVETRFARDLPELLGWIDGGPEPSTITDANIVPARLLTLRNRNSAAYKGVSALLLKDGGQDFRTGDDINLQMYFDDRIDIHHIFPQDWCRNNRVEPARCDSIVNKTPLSAKTNKQIGGNAPSVYLPRIEKSAEISSERMNQILVSHVIDAASLRLDDFDRFFAARESGLLERIECAMGKPIPRGVFEPAPEEIVDYQEDNAEAETASTQ